MNTTQPKNVLSMKILTLATCLLFAQLLNAQTFVYTGAVQNYTVPPLTTVISVTVNGASGGGGYAGARYTSTLAVTPGQVLQIYVGGQGGSGSGAAGGFNGGGQAGGSYGNEGGGGGASDIRISPYGLLNRIIVAGGGGGNGGWAGGGGGIGGLNGFTGGTGQGGGGGGGTSVSGGAGGFPNGCGFGGSGTLGQGGAGGFCSYGGGGGGGGYYGGGGGGGDNNACCADGGGGGGGSSFCVSAGAVCTDGANVGNGQVIICVSGTPAAPVDNTPAANLVRCSGNTTTLSAVAAGSVLWYTVPSGGTPVFTGASFVTPSLTANTTYYTETQGCSANSISRTAVTITVNPNPTLTVNSGTLCSGNSFTIVPSGASTYTYQGGSAVVSPTANATYTVTGTSAFGCISQQAAFVNITVYNTPTVSVNSGTLCTGNTFTISASGANTYSYSGGSALVSPLTNTSYVVTGISVQGCTNTAVSSIIVYTTPTITVNSGAVCAGQSFTILPSGANTYSYQGGSAIITPLASGAFTVIGVSALGCVSQSFATSNITVNPVPIVSVSSGSICTGSSFSINPTGAFSYTISGGNAVVTPSVNSNYFVTGTSSLGCVSSNTAISSVTVFVTPIVSVNSGTICSGNSFTIVPNGAPILNISGGASVVAPLSNATYSITGTSAQGCPSSNTAICNVLVNITPTVSVNSGSICQGQSFVIVPSGAANYLYSGGSATVSPNTTTTYSVTGISAQGCPASNTVISNVTVNITPTISVNSGVICVGQSFTMVPSGASTYTFSNGSAAVSPSVNAIYFVTGTSAQGCIGANSAISAVTVNTLPQLMTSSSNATICTGETSTITANGAMTYFWSNSGTSNSIIVSPSVTTTYSVTGTAANGCTNTTTYMQNVSLCTGLNNLEAIATEVLIYPNPSSSVINIEVSNLTVSGVKLLIFDAVGRLVADELLTNEHSVLDVSELAKGLYTCRIQSGGAVKTIKLVKE